MRPVSGAAASLFLPGFAAPAALYRRGLPSGWRALDPPGFRAAPDLRSRVRWLLDEVAAAPGSVVLGGHSAGAALAVLAAAATPERVERLVLVSPAGRPLAKPLRASASDFVRQLAAGAYPLAPLAQGALELVRAPRAALRLAHVLHDLDLSDDMRRVRAAGVPVTVIGCSTDTLVTGEHCRQAAHLLGARYRELTVAGGHMWMLGAWALLAAELAGAG